MGLLDPPTYSRTQADARYQPRTDPAYTAVLGDSIDADASGWWPTACAMTGQRMRYGYNGGVGGNTTTQALARLSEVTNLQPKVCVIGGGVTNDIGQGFAASTTIANIQTMTTGLLAVGITPLLRGCPPRGSGNAPYNTDAAAIAAVLAHNAWAESYAESAGIDYFDMYAPLVDSGTGLMDDAYTDDGIHPNAAGARAAAVAFREADFATFALAPPFDLVESSFDVSPADGLFLKDDNADGLSNFFSSSAWATKDLSTSAPIGKWQHLAIADGGGWGLAQTRLYLPAGTYYEAGFRLAVVTGPVYVSLRAYQADDTTAVGGWNDLAVTAPVTTTDGAVYVMRGIMPLGSALLRLYVQNQASTSPSPGAAELRIAQFTLRRRP